MSKNTDSKAAGAAVRDSLPVAVNGVIAPFIATSPVLAASLGLAAAVLGGVILYRQERFNNTVQSIMDNPSIFTDKVLQSDEFRDGFIVHLDTIFKLRGEEKLIYAQRIFSNFAKSSDMPVYPLERYDDTLSKISDASIRFLGFIDTDIPKIKEKYVLDKMRQNNNPLDDESKDKFREIYTKSESLDKFVSIYIDERAKREAILSSEHSTRPLIVEEDVKKTIATEIELTVSELEQLGIISRYSYQTQGWSSNYVSGYNLTHYGRMFISVLRPEVSA